MFSKHFGIKSDAVRLETENPPKLFLIPGVEWSAAVETAIKNGWQAPGLYDLPGGIANRREREYGPYHRYMEASDAGQMAAALRRAEAAGQGAKFPTEIMGQLEDWAKEDKEILVTSDLIGKPE